MPPKTPDGSAAPPAAARLRNARCLFHPLREAAALCPHCHGTFCRECVTDEENRLACPPCLRRMSRPPAPKTSAWRNARQIFGAVVAVGCLAALLFSLLMWRVNTPETHMRFDAPQNQASGDSGE